MKRAAVIGLYVTAAVVAMAFLLLPIVAIYAHTSPGRLVDQLSNPIVKDAFIVSMKTSLLAQLLIVLLGTPTAYLLATNRFPGHSLAVTLVELPLVLPPAVAGIGLLAAFGHLGLLGSSLEALGIRLPFTQSAVTVAVAYVASPSTSARRSRRSRRPTRTSPQRRGRSAQARRGPSSGSCCRWPAAG